MLVKSMVTQRNEDAVCNPGDIFELRESIAAVWIKNGWAKPYSLQKGALVQTAVLPGAPEKALSRRGRRRKPADE